jgi:hypothetical protein
MIALVERAKDQLGLVPISLRLLAGRFWWSAPLLVLLWPAAWLLFLALGWREDAFDRRDVQGFLIGVPLVLLGAGLGLRIIAGEIDRRTLEIAYTVPGGATRVWTAKLLASLALILPAEALLALAALVFVPDYPPAALYGAFQAAIFYLVLAMALSTLFKSEATGGLVLALVLVLNLFLTGFGQLQLRVSPFWNPEALQGNPPEGEVLAWTIQNRLGFALITAALCALTFARAERREKMLR